ncbi:MAG: amidase, partial [Acutalibacteraceae bacterium]|nr:amidase [Acutalibacteraceae bacterium]
MNITELSGLALAALIHSGEISSVEVTKAFIEKIKKNDNKYNSFITITEELALRLAGEADNRIKSGNILSPLDGVPVAVKDCICVKDVKNTCASKMLKDFVSPYNAAAVEHLLNAGVVIIGKTNLDEFSMGSTNDTSYFGAVHNPWDLNRVPGGSSGGSAAAVAARLAPFALGSDTGGSVRQPASMCGI